MNRPGLRAAAGIFLLAGALLFLPGEPAHAGDAAGPGLEVFDGAAGVTVSPGITMPGVVAQPPPAAATAPAPAQPTFDGSALVQPARPAVIVPTDQMPVDPFAAPTPGIGGEAFVPDPFGADAFIDSGLVDPFAAPTPTAPAQQDPFATPFISEPYVAPAFQGQIYPAPVAVQPLPAAPTGTQIPAAPAAPVAPSGGAPAAVAETVSYPEDAFTATLDGLDIENLDFPGLAAQVQGGSLRGAADVVWQVARERRIVDATLQRGPRGSIGTATQFDLSRAAEAAGYVSGSGAGDTPLLAAYRINTILDALASPVVDDYGMAGLMEAALVRLYSDIYAVQGALAETQDDGVFLELHRTYIRAITTCDWFAFPRRETIADINALANRAAELFYPDGASTSGDVAGVSANMLHSALMLDGFARSDAQLRRAIAPVWRTMEAPARFVLDTAGPDGAPPQFGPRGSRELTPAEMATLAELFPDRNPSPARLGLSASASYPPASNQPSYGGIFVSRSGADAAARSIAVRFGPYGTQRGVPGHYDFGSFVLTSRNIRFIVDGGGYGGEAAFPPAHSTLELDGVRIDPASFNTPGEPVDSVWRTNSSLDYLTDRATFTDGKSWQRGIVYVKSLPGEARTDYWLVLDSVNMNGDPAPRAARVRYLLAPGLQAYHDGTGILVSAGYTDGSSLRIFGLNPGSNLTVSEGETAVPPSRIYDTSGGTYAAPAVTLTQTMTGNDTAITLLYPAENLQHRPVRIERDADIIRGRTGSIVVDHGNGRVDVVAWSPPGEELVTPTLNLQLSADLAVFRLRKGKIVRMDFVNLERFQAKEPEGGLWSMRVQGAAQTVTVEPEAGGGWQILSDPANAGGATFTDVNLGPGIARTRFSIRPGEMRVVAR